MNALTMEDLLTLSRRVASGLDARLQISGITSAGGGESRAEVFVALDGCHAPPCSLLLDIDRSDAHSAQQDLVGKLTRAIREHLYS